MRRGGEAPWVAFRSKSPAEESDDRRNISLQRAVWLFRPEFQASSTGAAFTAHRFAPPKRRLPYMSRYTSGLRTGGAFSIRGNAG